MGTVREIKTLDELKPGDWLAAEMMTEGPAEVLHTYPYPDESGLQVVHVLVRELGKQAPYGDVLYGLVALELATEDELAALREQAERAQKIADIRALADWLEANPDMPVPAYQGFQVSPGVDTRDELDVWNSAAEGIALVKRWAEAMGEPVDESLADRTMVTKRFGRLEYKAIAWHRDGRPEPEPDPTGLAYSRADDADDPTPVSGHRVEPHVGGVTDGGLVDETPCYVPNGFQAPEVIAERRAYCRSTHPGRECSVTEADS